MSSGQATRDVFVSVEDFILTGFDDMLVGDMSANSVHGSGGQDLRMGGGGDHSLFGDAGNDTLLGGLVQMC